MNALSLQGALRQAADQPLDTKTSHVSWKSLQTKVRAQSTIAERYPMYLISVANLLALEALLPHQELKRRNLLVRRTVEHQGNILFVSHQWLGWEEPDPHGAHLGTLQRVLRRLIAGDLGDIESDFTTQLYGMEHQRLTALDIASALPNAFIWMDYISMPQKLSGGIGQEKEGMDAINSIPAYVERSTIMLVLVPPTKHKDARDAAGQPAECDYKSWRSRGWCRMEYVAALLARRPVPLIVVRGADGVGELGSVAEFSFPIDALSLAAGEGQFTCCAKNHDFGNGPIPCDKHAVRAVMETMLDAKVEHLFAMGEILEARSFENLRPWLLRGLPMRANGLADDQSGKDGSAAARLKRKLRWRGELEETVWMARTGYTLLHFAAEQDNLPAVKELLQTDNGAAGVNSASKVTTKLIWSCPGITPLMNAMCTASWAVVQALLDANADPDARNVYGIDAFMQASAFGRLENVTEWLRYFPKRDIERKDVLGSTALHFSALMGQLDVVRQLLAAGANPAKCNRLGWTPLSNAAMSHDAGIGIVHALLASHPAGARNAVNDQWRSPAVGALNGVLGLAVRLGIRNKVARILAATSGGTPLHFAALWGNVAVCRALVDAGADPTLRAARRRTALDLAHAAGVATSALEELLGSREDQRQSRVAEIALAFRRSIEFGVQPFSGHFWCCGSGGRAIAAATR